MGPPRRTASRPCGPGGSKIQTRRRPRLRPSAPCQATLRYPHHSSKPTKPAAHTKPGMHETRDAAATSWRVGFESQATPNCFGKQDIAFGRDEEWLTDSSCGYKYPGRLCRLRPEQIR